MGLDRKNVYLLLGSNLGDREALVNDAVAAIEKRIGEVFAKSSCYETDAWGNEDQPSFLNVAVGISTKMEPLAVLEEVLSIELELGRVRQEKWGSRLIDIDIILFDDLVVDLGPQLQVPHPQMQHRKFVLTPLTEIAGNVVHPVLQKQISEILSTLEDNLTVTKI